MDRNFLNDLLGNSNRPTVSSWTRERMEKERQESNSTASTQNQIPTREEVKREEKKRKRIKNLIIFLLVVLTLLYEQLSGRSIFNTVSSITPTESATITESTEAP